MKRQRFDPAWLGALGLLGFLGFIPGLEPLRLFFLFSVLSLFAPLFRRGKAAKTTEEAAPPMLDVPLNGPAQRSGASAFMAKIGLSYALTFLNPIQLAQMLAQAFGQLIALIRTRGQLPDAASYAQKARYTLPFEGKWFTFNGGVTPATSHSWEIIAQRYAYDFVIADGALMRHRGSGEALVDYLCYGQALVAPAEGDDVQVDGRAASEPQFLTRGARVASARTECETMTA